MRTLVRITALQRSALRFGISRAARGKGQVPASSPVISDEGRESHALLPGKRRHLAPTASEACALSQDIGFGFRLRGFFPDRRVGAVGGEGDRTPVKVRRLCSVGLAQVWAESLGECNPSVAAMTRVGSQAGSAAGALAQSTAAIVQGRPGRSGQARSFPRGRSRSMLQRSLSSSTSLWIEPLACTLPSRSASKSLKLLHFGQERQS